MALMQFVSQLAMVPVPPRGSLGIVRSCFDESSIIFCHSNTSCGLIKFMYQYRSGLLPYSFNDMFLVTHQVHSYGTKSSEFFYLPQCRTNIRKFSISFQGPKFFNSLSFEIRNATSTASFCCKLKAFLLS